LIRLPLSARGRVDTCQRPATLSTYSAMPCAAANRGWLVDMNIPNPADKNAQMSPFKLGLDWVYRSVMLFKQSPPKWLLHALLYVVLFVMLPSIPGMPVLISLIIILFWPT